MSSRTLCGVAAHGYPGFVSENTVWGVQAHEWCWSVSQTTVWGVQAHERSWGEGSGGGSGDSTVAGGALFGAATELFGELRELLRREALAVCGTRGP